MSLIPYKAVINYVAKVTFGENHKRDINFFS